MRTLSESQDSETVDLKRISKRKEVWITQDFDPLDE